MKQIAIITVSVICLSAFTSFAKDTPQNITAHKQTLSSIAAPEMPAKAAELVKKAKARDWGVTTVDVVKSAVQINPAAAPTVVGAVSRAVPEMAPVAASTAAAEQPKQAVAIAKAAAAAAPSKAGKIAAAVCRVVPAEYRSIAVAVAEAAPGSNREVLNAVAAALPELKSGIESALAGVNGAPPVAATLDVAANSATAKGPVIRPPYMPITAPPVGVTPSTSGQVPTGGRDYAKP
jgi:hypothetical protein